MNIIVPVKLVPDLIEELRIDEKGLSLDPDWVRLKLNEFDDHAIEQAVLLKERGAGPITVIVPEADSVEDVLYTASARGADRLIKLCGDFEQPIASHILARSLFLVLQELQPGLVLTGVQAHNDLDGPVGPLLAEYLGFPYVGYVAGVSINGDRATIRKEFPGGLVAEMEVSLPAVLGIQAAEQPPRYVAFNKIRQAMKTASIEERLVSEIDASGSPIFDRMFRQESGTKADMIPGDAGEVASRLVDIFMELGVI